MNRYEWIANRAYRLWEKAGRPCGRDLDFWLAAESEHNHCQRTQTEYRENEGQRQRRTQYGLRELQPTDKMAAGNRKREQEQRP